MAKWRHRTCICGKMDFTASKSEICAECYRHNKMQECVDSEKKLLRERYYSVSEPITNKNGHRVYTFTHSCGTEQTWTIGNLKQRIKADKLEVPCRKCGGRRRAKAASKAFIEIYGRDYSNVDYSNWEEYRYSVRKLTEVTWNNNQSTLNPNNLNRSMSGWHLDHIIPIALCFREGVTVEKAASKENLRLITAQQNLARGWYEKDAIILNKLENE